MKHKIQINKYIYYLLLLFTSILLIINIIQIINIDSKKECDTVKYHKIYEAGWYNGFFHIKDLIFLDSLNADDVSCFYFYDSINFSNQLNYETTKNK